MAKFYRINQNIQASSLRVIDASGSQLGILTKQEALDKSKEAGLDLIEVAPNADPPVARIIDFQKFRYQETKKDQAGKRSSGGVLKELWLSPRIAEHDLMVRLNRAEEFLKEGDKVKLTVKFKGREMAHPENGHQVLEKCLDHFGERIVVERDRKFEGKRLSVIIAKAKGVTQNEQTKNEQVNTKEN